MLVSMYACMSTNVISLRVHLLEAFPFATVLEQEQIYT